MNICHVILSEGWGGAETVVYELSKHLRDKGHTVTIVLNQEMLKYYADLGDVQLFNIGPLHNPISLARSLVSSKPRPSSQYKPGNRVTLFAYTYYRELLLGIRFRRVRGQVRQFLHSKDIDVLHAHLEHSVLLASLLGDSGVPVMATFHGEVDLRGMSRVNPVMKPLLKWRQRRFRQALKNMCRVTHVSHNFMADALMHWGNIVGDRSVVIHNGIDVDDVQRHVNASSTLKGRFNLLFPGGPKSIKGGDVMMEAFSTVRREAPDAHLYVAPEVPEGHAIRRLAKGLGLEQHVTFVGTLPVQEYRGLLSAVDVLVMPSTREAFGIVFVEAMALGKPVVGTMVGGIPEAVADGRNGILVEPDPAQIAEAVLRLYKDEGLRRQMSRNNLEDVAKFDWDHIVDEYIKVYEEVCSAA